jgi:Uma2 family endonuclease
VIQRLRMSYEEFYVWSGDDAHAEWVDGEVFVLKPEGEKHQLTLGLLRCVLSSYSRLFDLGVVLMAPFEMRLSDGSAREPDILFIARKHFRRRTQKRLVGPADLALEIVSDQTAIYDWRERFLAYQTGGVSEYWLVDPRPEHCRIDALSLSGSGVYEPILPGQEGHLRSLVVPGFWLKSSWFCGDSLPDYHDLMLEIAPDAFRSYIRRLLDEHGFAHR